MSSRSHQSLESGESVPEMSAPSLGGLFETAPSSTSLLPSLTTSKALHPGAAPSVYSANELDADGMRTTPWPLSTTHDSVSAGHSGLFKVSSRDTSRNVGSDFDPHEPFPSVSKSDDRANVAPAYTLNPRGQVRYRKGHSASDITYLLPLGASQPMIGKRARSRTVTSETEQFPMNSDDDGSDAADKSQGGTAEGRKKAAKVRATQACDKCREQKCKCIPDPEIPHTCIQCAQLGVECTYRGPSMKRGPPKGYLAAVINRLETMEDTILAKLSSNMHDDRARQLLQELVGDNALRMVLSGRLLFSSHRDRFPRVRKGAGPHGITWQDSWWVSVPGVPTRSAQTSVAAPSRALSQRFAIGMAPMASKQRAPQSNQRQDPSPDGAKQDSLNPDLCGPTEMTDTRAGQASIDTIRESVGSCGSSLHPASATMAMTSIPTGLHGQETPIDESMLDGVAQYSSQESYLHRHGALSALCKTSDTNRLCVDGIWRLPALERSSTEVALDDIHHTSQCTPFHVVARHFGVLHRPYYEERLHAFAQAGAGPNLDCVPQLEDIIRALKQPTSVVKLKSNTVEALLNTSSVSLLRAVGLLLAAYCAIGNDQIFQARTLLALALVIAQQCGVPCSDQTPVSTLSSAARKNQQDKIWAGCLILDKTITCMGEPPLLDLRYSEPVMIPRDCDHRDVLTMHHLLGLSTILDDISATLYTREPIKASSLNSLERRLTQCYYNATADFAPCEGFGSHNNFGADFVALDLLFHQAYIQLHSRFITKERREAALSSAMSASTLAAAMPLTLHPPWVVHTLFVAGSELVKAATYPEALAPISRLQDCLLRIKNALRQLESQWPLAGSCLAVLEACAPEDTATVLASSSISGLKESSTDATYITRDTATISNVLSQPSSGFDFPYEDWRPPLVIPTSWDSSRGLVAPLDGAPIDADIELTDRRDQKGQPGDAALPQQGKTVLASTAGADAATIITGNMVVSNADGAVPTFQSLTADPICTLPGLQPMLRGYPDVLGSTTGFNFNEARGQLYNQGQFAQTKDATQLGPSTSSSPSLPRLYEAISCIAGSHTGHDPATTTMVSAVDSSNNHVVSLSGDHRLSQGPSLLGQALYSSVPPWFGPFNKAELVTAAPLTSGECCEPGGDSDVLESAPSVDPGLSEGALATSQGLNEVADAHKDTISARGPLQAETSYEGHRRLHSLDDSFQRHPSTGVSGETKWPILASQRPLLFPSLQAGPATTTYWLSQTASSPLMLSESQSMPEQQQQQQRLRQQQELTEHDQLEDESQQKGIRGGEKRSRFAPS